jgi:predicted Zn-dependent peptidase
VRAGVTRQEIRLAWVTPRLGDPGDLELELASAILVGRGAGWLEHALLTSPRLCASVAAHQESRTMASIFEIRAVVTEGRDAREAMNGIVGALARFERGVTDDEIQRARLIYQHGRLFGLESSLSVAQRLAALSSRGPLPPVYDGQLGEIAAVSSAAVRQAVRVWLGVKPWFVSFVLPTRGMGAQGQVIGHSELSW